MLLGAQRAAQVGDDGGVVKPGALTHAAATPLGLHALPGVERGQVAGPQVAAVVRRRGVGVVIDFLQAESGQGFVKRGGVIGLAFGVDVEQATRLQARDLG